MTDAQNQNRPRRSKKNPNGQGSVYQPPKTYQGYEGICARYLVPELGRRKLERLRVQDVRGMLTRLQYDCRCCRDGIDVARTPDKQHCCAVGNCCRKTLSVRSIQYIHAVLRAGLQQAMREDVVMRNVAKLIQVQAPNYRVDRGLSAAEARTVLQLAKDDRLHALYVLALYLGMRRAELLGLPWDAVDLDQGVLEVRQSLQRVRGELRLVPTKSKSWERPVPLRCASERSRPTGPSKLRNSSPQAHPAADWCSPAWWAPRSSPTTSAVAGMRFGNAPAYPPCGFTT
jgi:integrase